MKIFAGGIETETNTFSPDLAGIEDFQVLRGKDVIAGRVAYPSLNLDDVWGRMARARDFEFVFGLMASAQPSGTTVRSAYESLRDELLKHLRDAMPVDIVLLMLHGAMIAQGYDGCEEDLIRRVRDIVGRQAVIGVELDLHCHLSESTIAAADVVITFKEYPHTDVNDRAAELFDLCVKTKEGAIRPAMELFNCHMVGLYPTTREPLRSLVEAMSGAEKRSGVLSVSFGHGFPFADVPHVGAKMLVVTDSDPDLARQVAQEFGYRVYELRSEIGVDRVAVPLQEALTRAVAQKCRPVVVADVSDNTGGGAPGDSTFALRWLLENRVENVAVAILYDPEVVRMARKSGVGGSLSVRLGGKTGYISGDPIDLEVKVLSMHDNYMHTFPQRNGNPLLFPAGNIVAVHSRGIDIVVSSARCQCFDPSIFSDLGVDVKSRDIVIVKSMHHFYGGFAPIAGEVIYMSTMGATAPDPKLIDYRRLDTRTLYPWTEDPLEHAGSDISPSRKS